MAKMKSVKIALLALMIPVCAFAKTRYISPNNDGVQDTLEIPLRISDKRYVQGWSLVIMDSNKNVVRTIENKVSLPEKLGIKTFFKQLITPKHGVEIPSSITWNGTMDNGELAPDGTYFYYITAIDDNGNKGQTKEFKVVIDTVPPEVEIAQPGDKIFGEGAKAAFKVRQSGSKEDLWVGTFASADGKTVRTYTWKKSEPLEFSWKGTDDLDAQLPDGVYSYDITATDRAGNKAAKTGISNIIYSAEKPATNIYLASSRYFSPETESLYKDVKFNITIPVPEEKSGNKLVEWALTIEDRNGKAVRVYNQSNTGAVPPSEITFDGTDGKTKLKDGEYRASITAKYLNGYVPTTIYSPYVVLDTEKPVASIKASETTFGAGSKDSVKFTITTVPSAGAPVQNWKAEIKNVETNEVVRTYDFGAFPPDSVTWNGVNDKGQISEKGKYQMVISAVDLAGNAGGGQTAGTVTFDTTEAQLLLAMSDSAFSPKPDGNSPKKTISFTPLTQTKEVKSYTFTVKDSSGKAVYKTSGENSLPASFTWDGKADDKTLCADGNYSAQLSLEATNGSQAAASTQIFVIDTVAPSLTASTPYKFFSPDGDSKKDKMPVTITNCSSEKLWTANVLDSKNQLVKKYTWSGSSSALTWDGTDESGNVAADGVYSIEFTSTDEAGNSFKSVLPSLTLDSRETKAYLTADLEGISPNGDSKFDTQKFEITLSVPDGIKSWVFNVRKEDGSSVFALTEKDSANVPAVINWNGAGVDGNACEGTFTGTLDIEYEKGNVVSAVSSPFVCTATAPQLKVQTAPEYFSPDNDGTDDDLFIKLSCATKAQVKNWNFTIKDPKGKDFWVQNGKNSITERLIWDGLSNVQKDSKGRAERVQSAMDYPYEFTVTDNLGMTNTVTGQISVDVLVIRDGNVLKMAVPSIIFESDAANFQAANAKLAKDKVDNNIKILNRIAEILKKFKDYKVTVVGHANKVTDNPEEETVDNMNQWGRASQPLSKERADAIRAYLMKKGVSGANISTEGMGGTKPVVNPKDKDNNWKNRRVEFILVK
ncbi:FlgD immunoglobulin-like domain containing protein [Treponema sp. C6A8]|uniref:FlgD immunoglobulin-like domain containing protein n=1 Tax=Treponema sp. C6A8 TaxID=1410609 RepID=UPI0004822BA4|nr:FlgD immunoglobulin-like domain containing protein [Treponema sp. C6A8]